MYQIVSEHDFTEAFRTCRPDNFSYAGLQALYEWLLEYEEGLDEGIEFDCIGLCCEFTEYGTALEAAKAYDFETNEADDEYDTETNALRYLEERTGVIVFKGGIIIQEF